MGGRVRALALAAALLPLLLSGTGHAAAAAPTAVSVTPSSGSGTTQTFSFLFSDTGGASQITYAHGLINGALSWQNACGVLYIQNGNQLYLVLDSGTGWLGPLTPGQAGTISNSQCTLDAGASSVSAVGNNLTVNAALTFKPAFGGNKTVFLDAEDVPDNLSSGFQTVGSWSVPTSPPTAVSVAPNAGSGTSQTFSFLSSDAGGAGKIGYVQALINGSFSWYRACAVLYYTGSNTIYLVQDNGAGWQGPLTIGQAGTLQNSQCTLDAGASSASAVGNNLTLNAALSFKGGFGGSKTVLLDAEDTGSKLSSGFQTVGNWTVPISAPTAVSVTPSSGTGAAQTFSFLSSDASGAGQITYVHGLINGSLSWQNACAVLYIQGSDQLYLVLDSGTGWQGPLTPGQAGTLSNSQCTLNGGASSVSAVGNNLTVNAALSFQGAFTGTKTVYLEAEDASNNLSSGWQARGTWSMPTGLTVSPSANVEPVNATQQFTATVWGETNQSVTWKVNDLVGGSATTGTITATGLYLAPPSIPGAGVVTVKAVSVANANKTGTATVTISLPTSDNYPRSDATSVLRSQPPLPQVPLTGSLVAVLDWTAKDADATQEDLLAVCHSLSEMGIPHVHTTALATATGYPVVAVAGAVTQNKVNNTERDALAAYAQGGGTLLLWGPTDTGLLSRLGVPGYASTTGTTVRPLTFDPSTGDKALRYIDDDVEINLPMEYTSSGSTREYTAGSAHVLATWTSGLAGFLRSDLGTGRAYVFGWRLRTVLSNAERQLVPGVEPHNTNVRVLDADIARLLVRAIYEGWTSNPHLRQFAPNGKPAALILTHDVDAETSYALTPEFVQFEQTLGVKSTYLFNTNPYATGWLEAHYTTASRQNIQYALDQGFNVESHGFGHFPDYDQAALGTGTENASNYFPYYSTDLAQTIGMSAIGEAGVSRWLLERDFPITVGGFRTGYLDIPAGHLDSVKAVGYNRDSTYSAGLTRGFVPFVPFAVSNGVVTTYPFLEYPVGLGDSNNPKLTADNLEQVVDAWETVIRTNYKNNVPTVILIHPTSQLKEQAQQELLQRVSDLNLWIGDWKTFDDFWRAQGVTCSQWP